MKVDGSKTRNEAEVKDGAAFLTTVPIYAIVERLKVQILRRGSKMRSTSQVQSESKLKEGYKMRFRIFRIMVLTLVVGLSSLAGSAQVTKIFPPPYGSNVDTLKRELVPGINKADSFYDFNNKDGIRVAAFGAGAAGARSGHGVRYTAQGNTRATIECTLKYWAVRSGLAGFGTSFQSVHAYLVVNNSFFEDVLAFGYTIATGTEADIFFLINDINDLIQQLAKVLAGPTPYTIKRDVYLLQGQPIPIFCGLLGKVSAFGGVTGFAVAAAEITEIKITEHDTVARPDLAVTQLAPSNFSPYVNQKIDLKVVVRNIGNKAADGGFNVKIFKDGQWVGAATVIDVPPYEEQSNTLQITCSPAGIHTIKAEVDRALDEAELGNNAMEIQITCRDTDPPMPVFLERPINPAVNEAIFPQPGPTIPLKATAKDNDAVATFAFYDEYPEGKEQIINHFCSGGLQASPPLPAKNVQVVCNWDASQAGKGPHRIVVRAGDTSGNFDPVVSQYSQIVHIDRDPPAVSFSTVPPLMDAPPALHFGKKVVDRVVKARVLAQDEGFIQKLWWELDGQRQHEKDFGTLRPWQYASTESDWNTRSLPSRVDYKVKACASDPFWPFKCAEQEVIVDNEPPHTINIVEPANNAQLNALTFPLTWLAGDNKSGLYGYLPIYKRGDKIDPQKLIGSAIASALGPDPDLRQAVDNPSILGNHTAFVNLGLVVIGGVKAQGIPDAEGRSIPFTAPTSPQKYTFYIIGVDRVGNYLLSAPVTVDVTVIMPRLIASANCNNARIKVTPPGTVVTGPKFGSFNLPQGTKVELEALDQQLGGCGGLPAQHLFKQWEVEVGTSKTTFTTQKIQITLNQDTTAKAIYEPGQVGTMSIEPSSWSVTLAEGESASKAFTVKASGGVVKGVTAALKSGVSGITVSIIPTAIGDIPAGNSVTFTLTVSVGQGAQSGTLVVRVSNQVGTPSAIDVPVTVAVLMIRETPPLVCPSGCRYSSIAQAIAAARSGDTITIGPGTYTENLVIAKSLTLRGAGREQTILKGAEAGKPVIQLKSDSEIEVAIENLAVTGAQGLCFECDGLWVRGKVKAKLQNVLVSGNADDGLDISDSAVVEVRNSTIEGNGTLSECKDVIFKCTGLELAGKSNIMLIDSAIKGNMDWGIAAWLRKCDYLSDDFNGQVVLQGTNTITGNNKSGNHKGNPGEHPFKSLPDGQVCLP